MLKILRAQDSFDGTDLEKVATKIIQSQHFWCTETELPAFLIANIHLFKTHADILKKLEKAFARLNECPECLIAYYKLRENLSNKNNEDILQDLDDKRLFRMMNSCTHISTTTLTEILTYNWKCLRICELKYKFVQQLKEFYRKENLVFSKMSFSLILLTQCGEPELLGYVYKIFKYLNRQKLLYLHSGPGEWNYLLEYTKTDERFVPSHSLIVKCGWLMSILIYIGLESTYCTDEIVPIIDSIYRRANDVNLRTMCFRVASAYLLRNDSEIKGLDLIYKSIFDTINAGNDRLCTSNVFLKDINYVLISQFRVFSKLHYDKQFYEYYSKKPEYTEAFARQIIQNCDLIGDFALFIDRYDFFVDIFLKIVDKEQADEEEKRFIGVCIDRFIGSIYKSLRNNNFDATLYHSLFTKWHRICINTTRNNHLFNSFIYLFIFDVEKAFCAYQGSEKLLDIYKLFKKSVLEILGENEEPLSDEMHFYSFLVKSDFSTYNVQSLMSSKNDQHALTRVLKKMNVYFDRFRNYPKCFTKMLKIMGKLHLVDYETYTELFNLLWHRKNTKNILKPLIVLLPRVKVRGNVKETFLYDLDWIIVLEKLDTKLGREIEEFIVAFYSWLMINGIGTFPSYKRTRIRNLASHFGIFLVDESRKARNTVLPRVKHVKNVPNKFLEKANCRLEKKAAVVKLDEVSAAKKRHPNKMVEPKTVYCDEEAHQPNATTKTEVEQTEKQDFCENFFLASDKTDKLEFDDVLLNVNDRTAEIPRDTSTQTAAGRGAGILAEVPAKEDASNKNDRKVENSLLVSTVPSKMEESESFTEVAIPEKENAEQNKNLEWLRNVDENSVKLISIESKSDQVQPLSPDYQLASSHDSDIVLLTNAEKYTRQWVDPKKAALSYLGDESIYGRLNSQGIRRNLAGQVVTEIKCVNSFYKNVLGFNLTDKKQITCSKNIPSKFKTYDEYFRIFEPLLLNECRDNLLKGIAEAVVSSKKYATLVEQASLKECIELTFAIERTLPDFEVLLFAYSDDNKRPKNILEMGDDNYFIGLIIDCQQGTKSCVTVRTRSTIKKPKLHSVLVYYDVCCFSSFFREYVALYKLQHLSSLPFVLASKNAETAPLVDDVGLVEQVVQKMYGLNKSQQNAIKHVYMSPSFFSLIHGPPGTGKTKMIVSLIESLFNAQIVSALKSKMFITNREPRVLICAPSNAAVDELARRINDLHLKDRDVKRLQVLRIGVQNNIDDNLKMLTLDCIIEKELEEKKSRMNLKDLEVTNSERTKRKFELLKRSNVVCATLSSSAKELIKVANIDFDILIIDEACQSVETSTLIPLKFNPIKVVLVGDPKQLPPTLISKYKPYEQSLFARLKKTYPSVLLNIQYRMHPMIVEFPNQYFYKARLLTHKSIQKRHNPYENVIPPISFIQINGEEKADNCFSFYNIGEARYIGSIISELMAQVKNYDFSNKIGIITPYKAQMKKIKEVLLSIRQDIFDFVCVNTVDGFQGQEKDVILISMVKSKNMGFLSDIRRINVSITRAKHSLIIIGNSKVLSSSGAWKSMLNHYEKKNFVFNHYKSIFIKK